MSTQRIERSHARRGNCEPSARHGQKSIRTVLAGATGSGRAAVSGSMATLV
jgi:hypothetical protein